MSKLSVNEFQKLLKEGVQKTAERHRWNLNSETERGYAFQVWLAGVVSDYEVGYDYDDPEEACSFSKDLKADIVFEDPDRQHLLICQAKYVATGKSVAEDEVNDFFNRHTLFSNRDWVIKNGSEKASELLADYGEKISSGYSVQYYFVSTGTASERVTAIPEQVNEHFAKQALPIRCELFDFGLLKDYYVRSLSQEESGPNEVVLRLPADRFFEKAEPYPTLVAVLKGNELRGLYQRYKDPLYAWNIRGYLGNRGINHQIFKTAQEDPENFFYFNNGVSAICTGYELNNNELTAQNLQIINGAQTISTLAKAKADSNIDVLFRLTQTKSVKTDKGINRSIIQYNNTQNSIKDSDFRSNDILQLWLENRFKNARPTSVLPELRYLRKRGGKKGSGQKLKLEELAKARYSFFVEPTLVSASPKDLWTLKDEGGSYEKAFGINGELLSAWSDDSFEETLLVIALYLRIAEETHALGLKSAELRFLKRLRFHALALAGVYCREKGGGLTPKKLLHSKPEFQSFWSSFWEIVRGILIDVHSTAMEQGSTMFAFVRSEDRWLQMLKRLRLRLAAI